ncbi:alpha/beta fold hydrolase [Falsigemmobacter faecalis]|uniref:Alpha/beta hydrolase n=1 Tax=Falsigemmobacter faecalis TaxID=2488730 RepID=A0A3P3DYY2_9RHOB|nr:alpha/beta hydrolase [Falsigemmobacter faecalis]RRH78038.1 alpha/beta hydrolase [Falsigemmobacter faecalis]
MAVIDGFTRRRVTLPGITLSVQGAGSGPPLILLHGFPQNGMCWSKVAPEFAKHFRVLVPDLRGYGESDAPADDAEHVTYSKRRMAEDIIALMDELDIRSAHLLGHDRGARVAYRLALDHPDRLRRLGIIEIVPTADFWNAWTAELAMAGYHWTFLAQPAPMPERLISADPLPWLDHTLTSWLRSHDLADLPPAALESYRAQIQQPERVHAMCADYRAGATTDRRIDEASRAGGEKITAPLSYLWAEKGFPAKSGDPLGLWRGWATDLTGASCLSGHFVQEENPKAVIEQFLPFFLQSSDR